MNKSLSFLVYAGIWVLMVLVQTFVISATGDAPSVFVAPELYYSTWCLDVYLILLFYLNYYVLVPTMIRRRLFLPYVGTVVVASLVGFLLPIVLYVAWQWTMPGVAVGTAPLSSLGVLGAIAAMSVGLAIRSIVEWIKLDAQVKLTQQQQGARDARVEELETRVADLTKQLEQKPVAPSLAPAVEGESSVVEPTPAV